MVGNASYFLREISKILLSITILISIVSISLYVLKRVPAYIQEREQRSYSSIEEAEYSLGLRIFLPSYFPDYLIWPPEEIKVTRKPSLMIKLVFISQGDNRPSLIIHEIISSADEGESTRVDVMEPKTHSGESEVSIGASIGVLELGVVEGGRRWTELTWNLRDRKMVLRSNRSVEDLLKIARSIHD